MNHHLPSSSRSHEKHSVFFIILHSTQMQCVLDTAFQSEAVGFPQDTRQSFICDSGRCNLHVWQEQRWLGQLDQNDCFCMRLLREVHVFWNTTNFSAYCLLVRWSPPCVQNDINPPKCERGCWPISQDTFAGIDDQSELCQNVKVCCQHLRVTSCIIVEKNGATNMCLGTS